MKVGDLVKVRRDSPWTPGSVGILLRCTPSRDWIVLFGVGNEGRFTERGLEVISGSR